ncbi:MAG: hypothetical protein WCO84_02770 [bacterium]
MLTEIPAVVFLVNIFCKQERLSASRIVFSGLLASSLTLPYLWFVLPAITSVNNVSIFFSEIVIVAIEAIIYNQLLSIKISKALLISLIANLASVFVGWLFW